VCIPYCAPVSGDMSGGGGGKHRKKHCRHNPVSQFGITPKPRVWWQGHLKGKMGVSINNTTQHPNTKKAKYWVEGDAIFFMATEKMIVI